MTVGRVFLLHHVHDLDGEEDVKLIGVYSSHEMAESARARLVLQPGFVDDPSGFEISAYELDKDHWTEGFLTVVRIEVPLRESAGTFTAQASRLANGLYELWPEPSGSTDGWLFQPRQTVRCESRVFPDGSERLVAVDQVIE